MTTHRHKDSRGQWTSTAADPDLSPYALKTELAALAARVSSLESPPPVIVPVAKSVPVSSIPSLLSYLADDTVDEIVVASGTYTVPNASSGGLWIDSRFAARTRPILVRAAANGSVVLSGGGSTYWSALDFRDGVHDMTWRGFRFADGEPTQTGVIVFGQNGSVVPSPPHHITLQDITIDETVTSDNPAGKSGDHAVYFSSATGPAHDLLIERLTVNARTSGLDSALHFYTTSDHGPGPVDVTVRDLVVNGTDQAVIFWDGTIARVLIDGARITGALRSAVRYEVGGTVTLRNVVSTGSGERGFYSSLGAAPAGATLVNCSLG